MSKDLLTIFLTNLEKALQKRKLTGSRLAFLMGINSGYIYQLLNGQKNPSVKTIEKICEVLRIDAVELFKK